MNHDDEFIQLQIHKYTFTCRKGKNKGRCRFDNPIFPFDRKVILLPFNELSIEDLKALGKKRDDIQTLLTKLIK